MKKVILSCLMLLWTLCGCVQDNQLPDDPWGLMIKGNRNSNFVHWSGNVSVKLWGAYSREDSLMMENSLTIINELCETVKVNLTDKERGDVEICFVENFTELGVKRFGARRDLYAWSFSQDNGILFDYDLTINKSAFPDSVRSNGLTQLMAFVLCPNYLDFAAAGIGNPGSVYDPMSHEQVMIANSELSDVDRRILKTVYAPDFEQLFPVAQKQYGKYFYWIRENASRLMFFPMVLVLILFVGLVIFFYKKWGVKIRHRLLRFNVVSGLSLLLLGVMLHIYSVLVLMTEPYSLHFYLIPSLLFALALGLPALNLIRLIELRIQRYTHHKYFRSLLLFLSTSLIPSVTFSSLVLLLFKKDIDGEGIIFLVVVCVVFVVIGAIRSLISFFIMKEKEIEIENDLQLSRLRELKTKAELNALHSKINPHFLYNSLNSIAGLAKLDADKTEQMALLLSKLFRYSINKEQADWSTLAEELEMVQIYLEIEKVRFEDRLDFSIELPESLNAERVPRFIIQPVVENAIKHGLSRLIDKGVIKIKIHKREGVLNIAVGDNGPDFPTELCPGFGLQGIYDKLEILYPNRFELHFLHQPDKQILIKLYDETSHE